jgi:hypothetical protein
MVTSVRPAIRGLRPSGAYFSHKLGPQDDLVFKNVPGQARRISINSAGEMPAVDPEQAPLSAPGFPDQLL